MNITVTKDELLATINRHRTHHHSRHNGLRIRYQRYLVQTLEHALQQAKADLQNHSSTPQPPPTFLPPPTDHTPLYDDLAASLTAHNPEYIDLPQDEYTTITEDRHAWHAEYDTLDARLTEHGV